MLNRQRRDPEIIGRHGRVLPAQLPINGGIVMRGLPVGVKRTNRWPLKDARQRGFIFARPHSASESAAQLGQSDERDEYSCRRLHGLHDRRLAADKISVPVGVQQQFHFHKSASIRR